MAGASPRCATIACLGWHIPMPIFRRRIPSPHHHRSFGQRIHSQRRPCFRPVYLFAAPPSCFWLAHSFATLPLLSAGVFIRRAALLLPAGAFIRHAALAFGRRIYSPRPSPFFRRRIPSPCQHHRLSWSVHPIAALPYRISETGFRFHDHRKSWCISSPHLHRLSRFAIWPAQSARLPRRDESPPLGWCTRS